MRRTLRKMIEDEQGQALTEFAMILPVLMMVLFAIFQFGVAFNNYIQVTSAAREGARKGAVSRGAGNCAAVSSLAIAAAQGAAPNLNWGSSGAGVTVSDTCVSNAISPNTDFTVTASYPWTVQIFGQSVVNGTMSSSTTMRVE
jgi:Flp pilus assembly protein TadG